ncbi:YqgE/AlgH family protein [Myxococcota bacterium]|nr:YqgE/AlgH family protein [Myxococcota bacterium]
MRTGLLIASPQMKDRWFERTVVLLCQHDEDGALGLVINRDGPVTVGDVLERMDLSGGGPDRPTWWGGPVGKGAGFVLWRGQAEVEEGWTLGREVAVSPSAERLTRLVVEGHRFQLALGYAGWGPGQLDEEIERGSWLLAEVDPAVVFDTPMEQRYDQALATLGLTAHTVVMDPISE